MVNYTSNLIYGKGIITTIKLTIRIGKKKRITMEKEDMFQKKKNKFKCAHA